MGHCGGLLITTIVDGPVTLILDVGMMKRRSPEPLKETTQLLEWYRRWKNNEPVEMFYAVVGIEHSSESGIVLTCNCCGYSHVFRTRDHAWGSEWSCPPSSPYVMCPHCPSSSLLLSDDWRMLHSATHARWEKEGRP